MTRYIAYSSGFVCGIASYFVSVLTIPLLFALAFFSFFWMKVTRNSARPAGDVAPVLILAGLFLLGHKIGEVVWGLG